MKYVDPDGKRCSLSVNYRTNTITISAKYYASRNDSRYAMKAADFWNNQKGQTYTANDGKVKKDLGVINNAIEAANKSLGNKFSNARKMTPKEINQFLGDKEWHDKNINKKSMIKELKGSTNADMYINRETKQIFLKGNKSNAWVDTGEVLQ